MHGSLNTKANIWEMGGVSSTQRTDIDTKKFEKYIPKCPFQLDYFHQIISIQLPYI